MSRKRVNAARAATMGLRKAVYRSREDAEDSFFVPRHRKRFRHTSLHAYHCPYCRQWHVGHRARGPV